MSIESLCTQMPNGAIVVGFCFYSLFEYMMGHTQFGSAVGLLIESPVATILKWVKSKL